MRIIIGMLSPALIYIFLSFYVSWIQESNFKELIKNQGKTHIIVRMPKAYLLVGVLTILVFGFFLVMVCIEYQNDKSLLWVIVEFCLFILMGVVIVFGVFIWKIEIFKNEDFFLLRTFTLITHKIQYCECKSFREGRNTLVLKTQKRTFRIDRDTTNFEFFVEMLNKHKVKRIR